MNHRDTEGTEKGKAVEAERPDEAPRALFRRSGVGNERVGRFAVNLERPAVISARHLPVPSSFPPSVLSVSLWFILKSETFDAIFQDSGMKIQKQSYTMTA